MPRASVRVLDNSGVESAGVFADEVGRFELKTNLTGCRVEASLTGFEPANIPCASGAAGQPVRLVLQSRAHPGDHHRDGDANRSADEPGRSERDRFHRARIWNGGRNRSSPTCSMATPGAMLVRNGGPGALTSLFVRGGESDYNKVLLDGVPLNEPGGTFYLSNLTTENLERVEIVRGAYSSLFGSDAMASVIQLFTKRGNRAAQRPQLSAQIDGGTYGTFHGNAGVSGATRATRLQLRCGAIRQRQPRAEQRAGQHDAQRERRRADRRSGDTALHRPRRARTRGHAGTRPPSDGRISTRFSSGTTASAASASISRSTAAFASARRTR